MLIQCRKLGLRRYAFLDSVDASSIVIVGTGRLAHGLAWILKEKGLRPFLWGRKGSYPVSVSIEADGKTHRLELPALQAKDLKQVKLLFFALKAYDLAEGLKQHLPFFPKGIPVIPVGNGAVDGIIEALAPELGTFAWRLGVTTLAVTRLGEQSFSIRGTSAKLVWGSFFCSDSEPTPIEAQLTATGAFFIWTRDPFPAYRKKWLFNTTLNSIVGADRLPQNGKVLRKRHKLMMVFSEAYALGEELWGSWEQPPEEIFTELLTLIELTSQNENSIVGDLKEGRPTETDYLAGVANRFDGYPILKDLNQKLSEPLIH